MSRFTLFLSLVLVSLLSACRGGGVFRSDRTGPEAETILSGQAMALTFTELDTDPAVYRNRLIRVRGSFSSLPSPECEQFTGPNFAWELVENDLHLKAVGFEEVMKLVPEGTTLAVDGFWRLYQGPLGCGKEPARTTIWYLETLRLVQPNPVPQLAAAPETSPSSADAEAQQATEAPTVGAQGPTPQTTPTATPTASGTPLPGTTPPATDTPDLSPTPTLGDTPMPTPTPSPQTGTPGATPTPTPSPTATTSGGATPTPLPPTNTPGPQGTGYPGPPSDPTETPQGYPN